MASTSSALAFVDDTNNKNRSNQHHHYDVNFTENVDDDDDETRLDDDDNDGVVVVEKDDDETTFHKNEAAANNNVVAAVPLSNNTVDIDARSSSSSSSPATRTLNHLSQQQEWEDLHYDMSQLEHDAKHVETQSHNNLKKKQKKKHQQRHQQEQEHHQQYKEKLSSTIGDNDHDEKVDNVHERSQHDQGKKGTSSSNNKNDKSNNNDNSTKQSATHPASMQAILASSSSSSSTSQPITTTPTSTTTSATHPTKTHNDNNIQNSIHNSTTTTTASQPLQSQSNSISPSTDTTYTPLPVHFHRTTTLAIPMEHYLHSLLLLKFNDDNNNNSNPPPSSPHHHSDPIFVDLFSLTLEPSSAGCTLGARLSAVATVLPNATATLRFTRIKCTKPNSLLARAGVQAGDWICHPPPPSSSNSNHIPSASSTFSASDLFFPTFEQVSTWMKQLASCTLPCPFQIGIVRVVQSPSPQQQCADNEMSKVKPTTTKTTTATTMTGTGNANGNNDNNISNNTDITKAVQQQLKQRVVVSPLVQQQAGVALDLGKQIQRTCIVQQNNSNHSKNETPLITTKRPTKPVAAMAVAITTEQTVAVREGCKISVKHFPLAFCIACCSVAGEAALPVVATSSKKSSRGSTHQKFYSQHNDQHHHHHHPWCPVHPDFVVGSNQERALFRILRGVESGCIPCQKELKRGTKEFIKHSCSRRCKQRRNTICATTSSSAISNTTTKVKVEPKTSTPKLQSPIQNDNQSPIASFRQKSAVEQQRLQPSPLIPTVVNDKDCPKEAKNDTTNQCLILVTSERKATENNAQACPAISLPQQDCANDSHNDNKETTLSYHSDNMGNTATVNPSPALSESIVPYCHKCSGGIQGEQMDRFHHHVMCPLHLEFAGSVMEGRLQDIRRGIRLHCEACGVEYREGYVKRSFTHSHSDQCQQQYTLLRQQVQQKQEQQHPHQKQQLTQTLVLQQSDPMLGTHTTSKLNESRDGILAVVPFCRLCNGQSSLHAVHHALCPKNPQFEQSGAKKKLERIRRGMERGCQACQEEFQHGGVSKQTIVQHNAQCLQDQFDMRSRTEGMKRKSRSRSKDDVGKGTKQKRVRRSESSNKETTSLTLKGSRNVRFKDKSRYLSDSSSDVSGRSDENNRSDDESSAFQPASRRRYRPLLGLLPSNETRHGHKKQHRRPENATIQPNEKMSTANQSKRVAHKRNALAAKLDEDESEPELMDECTGAETAQQHRTLQVFKPHWVACSNPWGPDGHQEGDVVLFSSRLGSGHLENVLPSPRYVVNPFASNSTAYHTTHRTPQEGYHLLQLQRDQIASRPWGFSVYRHDFGGACLVRDVQPLSPAAAAVYAGSADPIVNADSGLKVDDMLIAINGKLVGGMTEVAVEIEFEVSGPELLLLVSRYKFPEKVAQRIAVAEQHVVNFLDKTMSDDHILGWHAIGGLSNTTIATSHSKAVESNDALMKDSSQTVHRPDGEPHSIMLSEMKLNTSNLSLSPQGSTKFDTNANLSDERISKNAETCVDTSSSGTDSSEDEIDKNEWDDDDHPWMGCVCGQSHRKQDRDFWIQCDLCMSWYLVRSECVGFTEKQAKIRKSYYCWACSDDGGKPTVATHGTTMGSCNQSSPSGLHHNHQMKEKPKSPGTQHLDNLKQGYVHPEGLKVNARLDQSQKKKMLTDSTSSPKAGKSSAVDLSIERSDQPQNPILCPNATVQNEGTHHQNEQSSVAGQTPSGSGKPIEIYEAGALVMVKARSWPGVNSQGGVAKVVSSCFDDGDGGVLYTVKYIVGRTEKHVEAEYVCRHKF